MRRSDHGIDTARGQHWTDRSYCGQLVAAGIADPDAWYPTSLEHDGDEVKAARRLCAHCDVWQECRDYALDRDEREGVWGGLTPRERRALLLRRAVA
jgi:WhiB family redox-sensing transcriptional regulator